MAHGPLSGVRVVDVTMNMSGPLATMLLADQGADVVKIEPLHGDVIRQLGTTRGDTSPYFVKPQPQQALHRHRSPTHTRARGHEAGLVGGADVFVQNFRHGVAERLGLGSTRLQAVNPRLIHVSISGFGSTGPLHELPAYDHVVQALSGIAADGCRRPAEPGSSRNRRQGERRTPLPRPSRRRCSNASGTGETLPSSRSRCSTRPWNFMWPDGMMGDTALEEELVGTVETSTWAVLWHDRDRRRLHRGGHAHRCTVAGPHGCGRVG